MNRKLLLVCLASMLSAWPCGSQWRFVRHFPSASFVGGDGCHGLAVDPEGKIWIQLFGATDTLYDGATKVPTRQIFVFYPDGTPASFSGFNTISVDGRVDTLSSSNRGLRTDAEGNILIASGGTLYRVSYLTGAGLGKVVPDSGNTLTAPAVSAVGDIYVASVVPGRSVKIYDRNLIFKRVAINASLGYSRSFEVSRDGKTIYWAGYTNHAMYKYTTSDLSTGPFVCEDTVLKGFDAESFAWNLKTNFLWVSAGSYADPPNRHPDTSTSLTPGTWYAYNPATDRVMDSLSWVFGLAGDVNERPRALAFSPGGDTAYAAVYGNSNYPPVAMYTSPSTPVLTLQFPNGEENWKIGLAKKIRWSSQNVAMVKIELTTDDGLGWMTVAASTPASAGSYSWTVPDAPSSTCKVRVSATDMPSVADTSDQVFTISSTGFVAEIEPNGTPSQANYVEYGDSLEATLLYDTDVDYYKFMGNAGDTVYILATERLYSQVEVRLGLWTSSGQLLSLHAISGGTPRHSLLCYTLPSDGLYYIRGSSSSSTGPFPNSGTPDTPLPESGNTRRGVTEPPGPNLNASALPYGEYTLVLHRLPLAPELAYGGAYAENLFWNSLQFSTGVVPNGGSVTVTFEYGPTTSYGLSVPAADNPVTGTIFDVRTMSGLVTGFEAGQTYHMRAVARSSEGMAYSKDHEFTMPAAPTTWFPQPRATLEHIWKASFVNTECGWLISGNGITLHTTDGGNTWTIHQLPVSEGLTGICFVDQFRGWVTVGSAAMGGIIFTTADGGHSWSHQYSSTINNGGVTFINPSMGWVWRNNGTFLRTTNGGSSWLQLSPGTRNTIIRAFFIDANNGWAATGSSTIYHTTNGGTSWAETPSYLNQGVVDIAFYGTKYGWALPSFGVVARTTDGGASWTPHPTGEDKWPMQTLAFADSMNGWIGGYHGRLYITTDGGVTWNREETGTFNDLTTVALKNLPSPVLVGLGGTILRKPYVHLQSPNGKEVWKVGSTKTIRWGAWAIGDVELWLTVDSGATWSSLGVVPAGGSSKALIVPNSPSLTCKVRIASVDSASFVDLSDTTFAIAVVGPSTEAEPNNSASVANSIVYGDTVYGTISPPNDVDYFFFAASAGDTVEILAGERTNGQFYATVVLFDSAGRILAHGYTDAGPPYSQHLVHMIPASGLYFLRYSSSGSSGNFPNATVGRGNKDAVSNSEPPIRAAARLEDGGIDSGRRSSQMLAATGDYSITLRRFVPPPPVVSSVWVNSYLYNAIQFFGYVEPRGAKTFVSFEYGTDSSFGKSVPAIPNSVAALTGTFSVKSVVLADLISDTTYHVRVKAVSQGGTTYGSAFQFRTPMPPDGWEIQNSNITTTLVSTSLPNPRQGIIAGSPGIILTTTNGGAVWAQGTLSTYQGFNAASFLDPSKACVVGDEGIVLRTADAGATWDQTTDPMSTNFYGVHFAPSTVGIIVGSSGRILRTTNAALSWTPVSSGVAATLFDVTFAENGCGWVVGGGETILYTTDSGLSWSPQGTSDDYSALRSVSFGNYTTGVAVGDGGVILRTTDAGTTWTRIATGFSNSLSGVWCLDSLRACAVGTDGLILRTSDAGLTWRRQGSGTTWSLRDVSFVGREIGTIVGDNGFILRTTVPKPTWSAMLTLEDPSGSNGWLIFGQAPSATDGFDSTFNEYPLPPRLSTVSLDRRFIMPSQSGMTSLTDIRSDTLSSILWTFSFHPASCGYPITLEWDSIGLPPGTMMLKDRTAGRTVNVNMKSRQSYTLADSTIDTLDIQYFSATTAADNEVVLPLSFCLEQNYPNPFNPSTTIKYELPKSSEVRLSVFDMLGREVLGLVNERREAGYHEIKFDASGLASGVYFYRLQAGSFVETRKLLLVR